MNSNFSSHTSHLKIDERNHVEKPLLAQLDELGWDIIDLENKQHPNDSHRQTFTEVVMLPVLHEQLKVINLWLEDDQVEEVVKQLTTSFPGGDLIKNNRHAFTMLLENTSVSENRLTGEKSPTVHFVDFTHQDNNRFIAVCQFKVREMYRHARLSHWKVVFVTDRTQLEQQLSETSQSIGFTVKVADSIKKLKELLRSDSSDLVMAMINWDILWYQVSPDNINQGT